MDRSLERGRRIPLHSHEDNDTGGLIHAPSVVAMVGLTTESSGSGTGTPRPAGTSGFDELGWFNFRDYGAVDGSTDDAAAWAAVLADCAAAGGGTIYGASGISQVSGGMLDTSTFNAQIEFPFQSFSDTSIAIRILGSGPNRIYAGDPPDGGEFIIRSDWNGSISGHPALFSAGTWRDLTTARSNIQITFENLSIMLPDDPKLSALQLSCASTMFLRNVQVRTASSVPSGYGTHSNAWAIEAPFGLSFVPEEYSNVAIVGNFGGGGIYPSEQSYGTLSFAYLKVGMEFVAQQNTAPYIRWPNHFPKLTFVSCERGIKASGTGKRWFSGAATFEHDNSPFATTYDIDDSSNILHGFLSIHPTDFTTGPTDLLVNNAQKLSYHQPDQDYWRLNSQVHIPTGTDPSSNPFSGRTIYTASATGNLTGRKSTGATYDYEKLGGTVALTGTPSVGYAPVATSSSAATWQAVGTTYDTDGLILVDPGSKSVSAGPPFVVTVTSTWGVSAGVPYYDASNAVSGEEAALYYNPTNDEFVLIEYGF